LPGVTLKGHVDSLSPASGVSYSTIGAHNATGNFTKIAQRLPVKISLDAKQPLLSQLRAECRLYLLLMLLSNYSFLFKRSTTKL